ncbi:MAG: hypothetical protein ACKOCK_02990 [Chloroflexota bacterium]
MSGLGLSALTLGLAGCSGQSGPPVPLPTPAPTWAGNATVAGPTGVAIVERPTVAPATPVANSVVWVESVDEETGAPIATVGSFSTDAPMLRAVLYLPASSEARELVGEWSYNQTPMGELDTPVKIDKGDRWLSFAIARDDAVAWIPGTYALKVREGDQVVAEGSVKVVAPSS